MTSKTSVIVDLDEHALERLVERHPAFIRYTPDNSEDVMKLLNTNYNSGILHKRRHGDFANYVLEVLSLSGIFYLRGHSKLPNTYIASTFKILRKPLGRKSTTRPQDVTVEYSFNLYCQESKAFVQIP
jgi:hypothetical protein